MFGVLFMVRMLFCVVLTLSASILSAATDFLDLEVTYINRAPMYERYRLDYVGGKPVLQPGTENARRWPTNGEIVTFTGYIANKGTLPSGSFNYKWFIDGVEVGSGMHPGLGTNQQVAVTYQWAWQHQINGEQVLDDHTIRFAVDSDNAIAERFENNNAIEDYTAAMSFRLTITPQMVQTYSQPALSQHPFSAENWLQRQIAAMNQNFDRSIYPVAPNGGGLRVRINEIIVAASATSSSSYDGSWFVNADYRVVSGGYERATDIDWSLVHELSHQVGLIDIYTYNIESDSVHVLDADGLPSNFGFSWPRADLMGGGDIAPYTDGNYYSSFSAGGALVTKGFRRGYYGEFQYDIPHTNYLRILDNTTNAADGVQVELFQRQSGDDGFDNTPELGGVTDPNGRVLLANRSVGGALSTRTGHTLRDNPFGVVDVVGGGNTFLVKLTKGEHEEFFWLNLTAFNLAYWMGNTQSFELQIVSHVPPATAPAPPQSLTGRIQGQQVTLCWAAAPQVAGYYVYAAYSPEYKYQRVSGRITSTCFTIPSQAQNRVYAVTAVDSAGRESGFSHFLWAPRLQNPASIAVARDGTRIILDPQNGHALLEQRYDGRFIRNIGSVHYHLEFSRFLWIDELDRMIISHPADFYSSRHSVRMATRSADALIEFGQRGSGPGQFETPAGVAARGRPASIEGPWPVDASTILLLHFDGNHTGAQGESGTAARTSFVPGKYSQGVLITNTATLSYPSAGNILRDQGAIEFWFKPNWNGTNTAGRYFFSSGTAFQNGFRILKDGANNLRFLMWRGARESGVGYGIGGWRAGEWHHVAITWTSNRIALYVDGQNRSSSTNVALPDQLAATFNIGSSTSGAEQADGVIDEFRISDVPRVGNSDTAAYTIFVADSGNHRIQAFDEAGNFRAAFGSLGSGLGQFNDPRGLAIDGRGRVLVADRNNHRLQVLEFDGTNFTALPSVAAAFNQPIGVCAYLDSHWIVADTGNNQIKLLSATNGSLLASFSAPNDGYTGTFLQPAGVTVDQNGNILIADTGRDRIVTLRGVLPTNAPPRFLPEFTRWSETSGFQTRLRATPGQRLIIQTSSNLTHWTEFTNNIAAGSDFDLQISPSAVWPRQFFRALSP